MAQHLGSDMQNRCFDTNVEGMEMLGHLELPHEEEESEDQKRVRLELAGEFYGITHTSWYPDLKKVTLSWNRPGLTVAQLVVADSSGKISLAGLRTIDAQNGVACIAEDSSVSELCVFDEDDQPVFVRSPQLYERTKAINAVHAIVLGKILGDMGF